MAQKNNWQQYKDIIERNNIKCLYHFTDRENLESIINNGGLYSWADCKVKGIDIPKPGGSAQSTLFFCINDNFSYPYLTVQYRIFIFKRDIMLA